MMLILILLILSVLLLISRGFSFKTWERKPIPKHIPDFKRRKFSISVSNRRDHTRIFYTPPEVGPDIYVGAIAGVIPFIWATYQFTGRIKTQRECAVCGGSGLVKVTKSGRKLERYRKCWNCGGLLPWISWKMFFISSIKEIGNGGPLQQPAKDYQETNERFRLFGDKKEKDNDSE